MPDSIVVTSEDPALASWLHGRLAAMRLDSPKQLSVHVRVADAVPDDPDLRTPFHQPQVEIRSGPPLREVRLRWRDGQAYAAIAEAAPSARITLTPKALTDRENLAQTFITTVLVFLLRRAGWHHVHAAMALDPRGRGWLLAGNAKAGKSTTAALLAQRGWAVGSDDLTFLARHGDGVEAIAQRAPIALRPEGCALLRAAGGAPARGGRKTAWFPEELGGTSLERVRPTIIALPRVEGETTAVEPVSRREALAELVRWSAWVALEPHLAQDHLDLLAAAARQAKCYRLALAPDLFGPRDLLMELVP